MTKAAADGSCPLQSRPPIVRASARYTEERAVRGEPACARIAPILAGPSRCAHPTFWVWEESCF